MQYIKAIKTYCVSCKKNTVKKCFSIRRTKQKKINACIKLCLFVGKNVFYSKTRN